MLLELQYTGNVPFERSYDKQRLDANSSVSSDGRLLGSIVGDVSSTTKIGVQASYDVFKSSLQARGAIRVAGDYDQIGCVVSSEKQLSAFYSIKPRKHTQLVSKLSFDMKSRQSDLQIGCLFKHRNYRIKAAASTSGRIQSHIVSDGFECDS